MTRLLRSKRLAPKRGPNRAQPRGRTRKVLFTVCAASLVLLVAATVWSSRKSGAPNGDPKGIPFPDTSGMQPRVAKQLREARDAVVRQPASPTAWNTLGASLDAHELFDYAEAAYRRSLELRSDSFWPMYQLALVLDYQGRHPQEAVSLLRRAAKLRPRYPTVYFRLGEVLDRQGRFEEARDAFKKALAIDPNMAIGHRYLGQVLLGLGDPSTAIRHLLRALELSPQQDGPSYAILAQAYRRAGDVKRATAASEKSRRFNSSLSIRDPVRLQVVSRAINSDVCLARAERSMAAGDFAAAISDLRIAAESLPEFPHVHLRLAESYMETGRNSLAERHFLKTLRLRDHMLTEQKDPEKPTKRLIKLNAAISRFRYTYSQRP